MRGKAGARIDARSQDTGQAVLVVAPLNGADFSDKEKDGASLPNCFWRSSLNAFIPRFAGA
jgi:hypothetical protein